jgi:hypothetical protein
VAKVKVKVKVVV